MSTNKKPFIGKGMEGRIATWYAKTTRRDMAEFRNLADQLARTTPTGSRILEVAPGPGYLSIELAKFGRFEGTGLDISRTFVEIAHEYALEEGVKVDFQLGNASAMPFESESFDLVVCRAAFKNFSQPDEAINEMFRVLKPGGRAIIIDLRKDASIKEIDQYINQSGAGWLDALMMKFTFRFMLIPRAYSREQFQEMAARSRFEQCEIESANIGFQITLRKTSGGVSNLLREEWREAAVAGCRGK